MKVPIVFIHSAGPQGLHEGSTDLIAYLRKALGDQYIVKSPKMPDPENPRYRQWRDQLEQELSIASDEVMLIGHSLGGSLLLKYLSEETCKKSIAGLFLIAAAYWGQEDWEIGEYSLPKDFSSRLSSIRKIFLYHSLDDEWVPFEHLKYYADKFPQAIVRKLEGNEHEFNHGLPELIKDIKSIRTTSLNQWP